MEPFTHEYALVCRRVPASLVDGLSMDEHEPIDLTKATQSHEAYKTCLRENGLKLIEVDFDDSYPDCVFVEDLAVAVGNRIFLTNPGAESRRGEVDAVRHRLHEVSAELGLDIVECGNRGEAFIDGGDVCNTGREILVGLTTRTNAKGVDELQAAFPDIAVATCKVSAGLHLKSLMTMLCPDTILIEDSESGRAVRDEILTKSPFAENYRFVLMATTQPCHANVVYFNDVVVYPPAYIGFDELLKLHTFKGAHGVDTEEFAKIDGCLTCLSVLFSGKRKTEKLNN